MMETRDDAVSVHAACLNLYSREGGTGLVQGLRRSPEFGSTIESDNSNANHCILSPKAVQDLQDSGILLISLLQTVCSCLPRNSMMINGDYIKPYYQFNTSSWRPGVLSLGEIHAFCTSHRRSLKWKWIVARLVWPAWVR